mmetsp:Transcript_122341/g.280313  ORF Transcript_122341/g.280313 Transcript_122341/m.280313 type:complete len:91 (+) Transcript_122341:1854-2126(+)
MGGCDEASTSVTHINFFEEEEKQLDKVLEQHEQRIKYQQRNNEFAGGSRGLSDFDAAAQPVPWYLQPRPREEAQVPAVADVAGKPCLMLL